MGISLKDLANSNKVNLGLPKQEERLKFKQEVVLGEDGLYVSYLSDFYDVVYKIQEFGGRTSELLGGVGLPKVAERLEIKEKIKSEMIYRMIAWYRAVNAKYRTEATMQVFYDISGGEKDFPQELKDKYAGAVKRDGNFVYVIPEQEVSGGLVSFDGNGFPRTLSKELYDWALANYEPILNIHSHNSMDAFWSGTDDANELPLYNRLCLVIGRVDTAHPAFRFSWNFEGKRHHQEENIDNFIEPLVLTTSNDLLGYHEETEVGFDEALGLLDFDVVEFDERWYDRLNARVYRKQPIPSYGGKYGKFAKRVDTVEYKKIDTLNDEDLALTAEETEEVENLKATGSYLDKVLAEDELYDEPIDYLDYPDELEFEEDEDDAVLAEDTQKAEVAKKPSYFQQSKNANESVKKGMGAFEIYRMRELREKAELERKKRGDFWDDLG